MFSVQSIEQLCLNYTQQFDSETIFKKYISDNPNHLNLWQQAEKIVCNQEISQGQLAFICLTCSQDLNQLICSQCFNISKHQSHNYHFTSEVGKCKCGYTTSIQNLCENHSLLQDKNISIEKEIPKDLADKIELFIMTACSLYHEIMKQIENQWSNFRLPIMELYHLCHKLKIEQLKQTIDQQLKYQNYYILLLKSQYLHQMIFSLIDWLTKDRLIFQNLIASIFQKQLPNINQSLYECLMRNQALQESTSPEYPIFIGEFIERLTSNSDFFEFISKVNLRIYSSFFLLAKNSQTQSLPQIYQIIDSLTQMQEYIDTNYLKKNKKQINEFNSILNKYLQELKQIDFTSYSYIQCEAIQFFRQSVNEIIMKTVVDQLDEVQAFNFLESIYCLIHQPLGNLINYPWDGIKFFGAKFRSEKFDKFNMSSLKKALGTDYDKFKNEKADLNLINNFNYEKYLLTKLINCFSKAKPSTFPEKDLDYKLSTEEQEEINIYINFEGEMFKEIQTGITSLFCDKESTENLKMNFILVILAQTYKLIKTKRNVGIRLDTLLTQMFSKHLNQKEDEKIKIFKVRKLYCYLKKNATILDKIFIQALCLHLSINEYSQPRQLLQFLQELFQDTEESIKDNFQQILQRCIQNYVTVWMMIDDKIDQLYYGYGEKNYISKLESIDTAFGKLYIYLFGETGLFDVYKAINNMLIPDITYQSIIINQYLLRIITSDTDIYNLSIFYFRDQENLPTIIQQALLKILQNIMNIEQQATLKTIHLKFEELGIVYPIQNKYLLNFLELDENTKLLKLKQQFPPLYDPILFTPKEDLRQILVKKLQERGMENKVLYFGNGLLWNIKQFHQENSYLIQKYVLNILSSKQNLIDNLQFSSKFKISETETSIFLYNQMLAAAYFRPEDLNKNKILILQHLNKLYQDQDSEINKQKYAFLIDQFKTFQFLTETQYDIVKDQDQAKVQFQESQNQIQQNIQNLKLIICDCCKVQITDKYSIPILLSKRDPKCLALPDILCTQLVRQDYNLMQVSINGCQHKYHPNCLALNLQSQLFQMQFPKWYKQACQICKQSFNIQFPLNKQLSQLEIQLFNKALLDGANECGLWNYLVKSNQNQNQNIIYELYLQIIIDLLQQIFIDVKRFSNFNRIIVFNQIIYLFEQTVNINQNSLSLFKTQPKIYKFDKNISIIFEILNSIQNNIIINQNRQQLKNEIITIILNLNDTYDQYKQTLLEIFEITKKEVEEFRNTIQTNILQVDPYIQYYQEIFDKQQERLNINLGQNFAEFHQKYITKGCDICKSYNIEFQNSKDILVCLMCEKVFCMSYCKKTRYGNLNEHSQQEHGGGSFYVSLITGRITLIQHPLSVHNAYELFYDEKFGQRELTELSHKDWQIQVIDQQKSKQLILLMIYNQYGQSICNKSVESNEVTIDGKL